MSYEIVYGTSFIDLGEGKYLPIILSGSNNCTMRHGNREILERNWGLFFGAKGITTKDNMLEWARNLLKNHTAEYEMEWFKKNGKWIVGEQIYKYIENACNNAKTIEEYRSKCGQSVQLSLFGYKDNMPSKYKENYGVCRTTQEIIDWFSKSDNFDMGEGYSKYINAEFWGIKPFGIKKQNNKVFDKPFLVKVGNQYLVDYELSPKSYSTSRDKTKARVFTDKDEFNSTIIPIISSFSNKSVTAISSETKDIVMPYRIKVVSSRYYNGSYLKRLTRNSVRFGNVNDGKKFSTERQAEKYIAEKLNGRFSNCEWVVEKVAI